MDRIEVNFQTGEVSAIQLTPEEEADALARTAAEIARQPNSDSHEAACVSFLGSGSVPGHFNLRKAFIAKAVSDEAYRLGKNPGALTGAELQALRNRIANIYKAL